MEVYIHRDPRYDDVEVYLFERTPGGTVHYVIDQGRLIGHGVERGEPMSEPTLRLPNGFVEILARALAGEVRVGGATEHHLKDAIAVRDRLLALIERRAGEN